VRAGCPAVTPYNDRHRFRIGQFQCRGAKAIDEEFVGQGVNDSMTYCQYPNDWPDHDEALRQPRTPCPTCEADGGGQGGEDNDEEDDDEGDVEEDDGEDGITAQESSDEEPVQEDDGEDGSTAQERSDEEPVQEHE